ncbi:MAG: OmpA family protein [Pseudomonadota bacterium]|nr:OmpA family protein [Pseudomonadota bacterium]MDP1906245.1 OmpA family protein [Pseudomonadota bacterium]MDP2352129.1 OmpA family protein [Pseudomonadota bacterium]
MKSFPLFFSLLLLAGCATQEPVQIVDSVGTCRTELAACDAARLDAEKRDKSQVAATQLLQKQLLEQQQQSQKVLAAKDAEMAACRGDVETMKRTDQANQAAFDTALARRGAETAVCRDELGKLQRGAAADQAAADATLARSRDVAEQTLARQAAESASCRDELAAIRHAADASQAAADATLARSRDVAEQTLARQAAESASCRDELAAIRHAADAGQTATNATLASMRDETARELARAFERKDAETARCRDELETVQKTAEADLVTCQAMREKLQKRAQAVEKSGKQVQRMKELEAGLRKRLQSEIGNMDVEIDRLRSQLSVHVLDRILFHSGSVEILPEGGKVLDAVAAALAGGDETIRIEGHTDNVPIGQTLQEKYFSNWELSSGRASSVVRHFIDGHGIEPTRMEAVGFSEYRPVASNDTWEGRQRNRRVAIVLTPWKPLIEESEPE